MAIGAFVNQAGVPSTVTLNADGSLPTSGSGGGGSSESDVQFFTGEAGNTTGTPQNCAGYAGMLVEVTASVAMAGGTVVAFLGNREASGGTFYPIPAVAIAGTGVNGITTSAVGLYYVPLGGLRQVRCDITGYSAGSGIAANATLYPTVQPVYSAQVTLSTLISGEDQTNNAMMTEVLAGENVIGHVGGTSLQPTGTFTRPSNTTAYVANQIVANSTSAGVAFQVTSAIRAKGGSAGNGGSGIISDVILIDQANQTTAGTFELWLFNANPSAQNDAASKAFTAADLLKLIGVVSLTSSYVSNTASGASGSRVYVATGLNFTVSIAAATTIYAYLVATNAYTPVSAEVFVALLNVVSD